MLVFFQTFISTLTFAAISGRPGSKFRPGRDDLHPGRDRDRDRDRNENPAGTGISLIPAGTGIFSIFLNLS